MSLGIPLSQLIVESPRPLASGINELDSALNDGFHTRSIYEIFGIPGIGKTLMGLQLVENMLRKNRDDHILWIETNKPFPKEKIRRDFINAENIHTLQISKFSELLIFFQRLRIDKDKPTYTLIIIDGFSQLVVNHLNVLLNRNLDIKMIHDVKCKHLALMLTEMTKYTHSKNSTIILLDDCMNTAYQQDANFGIYNEDTVEVVEGGSNFFVSDRSFNNGGRRKNVQVLKSALVANCAMGNKDSRWEVFIKYRIGLFWDWMNKDITKTSRMNKFLKTRVAIVTDLNENKNNNKNINPLKRSRESMNHSINIPIKFNYDSELKQFIGLDLVTQTQRNNSIILSQNNSDNSSFSFQSISPDKLSGMPISSPLATPTPTTTFPSIEQNSNELDMLQTSSVERTNEIISNPLNNSSKMDAYRSESLRKETQPILDSNGNEQKEETEENRVESEEEIVYDSEG